MYEVMTMSEIQRQYDSEWILLGDPETKDNLEVTKGKMLWHSKDRDEVYRKARELKPRHSAILFTGKISEEAVVVL